MKITTYNISLFLLCFFAFCAVVVSQDAKAKGDEDIRQITFSFEIAEESEPIVFNSKNSLWKLKYELRLIRSNVISKISDKAKVKYGTRQNSGDRKWNARVGKEYHKQIRENGLLISKGEIRKRTLLNPQQRKISVPVKISNDINKLLDDSFSTGENYDFVIRFRTRIEGETPDGEQVHSKIRDEFSYPFKLKYKGEIVGVDYQEFGATFYLNRKDRKIFAGRYRN